MKKAVLALVAILFTMASFAQPGHRHHRKPVKHHHRHHRVIHHRP